MGRYRAPQKPGSKYITPEGEQVLKDELHYLWKVKRPEVTQAVSEAAAQGDRSENAEYIYGKKQLRENRANPFSHTGTRDYDPTRVDREVAMEGWNDDQSDPRIRSHQQY